MKLLISLLFLSLGLNIALAGDNENLPTTVPGVEKMIQISGISTGYDKSIKNRKDGYIDFAIIMPSFTKKSLLFFDLNNILSPKSDIVSVINKKFPVPSNLSLPKQKESYFVSIKLNKPQFRTFIPSKGIHSVNAIHGKFKVRTVVNKVLDNRPIFDLLNDFKFLGGDQIRVNTNKKSNAQNVNIKRIPFEGKATITAPNYDKRDLTLLSLPLALIKGTYQPTDLKYVKSGRALQLVTHNKYPMFSLNIITDQVQKFEDSNFKNGFDVDGQPLVQTYLHRAEFNRITMSFMPLDKKLTPQFLDFIDAPQLTRNGAKLNFSPPATLPGHSPLATVVELVEGQKFVNGKIVSEFKKSLWKKVVQGWKSSISIPDINLKNRDGVTFRFEVSFVTSDDSTINNSTQKVNLNNFSLLTRNYLVIR